MSYVKQRAFKQMKHSRKRNHLQQEFDLIDHFSHLSDKQKREANRKLKKIRSKLERRENRRSFNDDYED